MTFGKMSLLSAVTLAAVISAGCRGTETLAVSSGRDGGVYSLRDDPPSKQLTLPTMNYLIRDPADPDRYYGTVSRHPQKKTPFGIVAVLGKKCGTLIQLQQVSAGGRTPCHLTISPEGKFLYTANYSSGDISEMALHHGRISGPPRLIRHEGKSVTKRQQSAHPHFVTFNPADGRLYVCDLGTDQIRIYDRTPETGVKLPCAEKLALPPGSGPRHLAFDPSGNILYTANELNSTAASFVRKSPSDPWRPGEVHPTVAEPLNGTRNSPGAIKITRDGRFFFITNRGHDSIAVFAADGRGGFKLLEAVPSQGKFPSDILLDEAGTELLAIHLKSGTVTAFAFDPVRGTLTPKPGERKVPQGIGLCR
ncbi:MAG: lactonase family protein [Lentisphaeria bacterium]|nr:lactonase family protein [Lentisphaeria bacterium]